MTEAAQSVDAMMLASLKSWLDRAEGLTKENHASAALQGMREVIADGLHNEMTGVIQLIMPSEEGRKAVRVFLKEQAGLYKSSEALRPLRVLKVVSDLFQEGEAA